MRALALVSFGLAVLAPSTATAQHEARAHVVVSDTIFGWNGPAASIDELCARAARTEWAMETAPDQDLVCSVDRHVAPRLAAVHVRHDRGEVLALAVERAHGLEIVAGLTEVRFTPRLDERARTTVTHVEERVVRGWPVTTIELRSEGEEAGVRVQRDDLVVCVHRAADVGSMSCVERAPLHVTTAGGEASATTTFGADGTLRVHRVEGSWSELRGDDPRPTFPLPATLVAVPARLDYVTPSADEAVVPVLFVEQWRAPPAAPRPPPVARVSADVLAPATDGPSAHEPVAALDRVCARAGSWLEVEDDHVWCELEATDVDGVLALSARNMFGVDAFVAVGRPDALRVVARIGRVISGPTQSGEVIVQRIHRRTIRGEEVLALETRTSFIDHDLGVLEAYGFDARHMTICAHRGDVSSLHCGAHIPLEGGTFSRELREVVVPMSFPYAWRETRHARNEAIAVLRADGTVRVTLRSGSWTALMGDGYESLPVAFTAPTERDVVVPMFP